MPRMLEMFSKTAILCAAAAAAGASGAAQGDVRQAPVPAGYDAVFPPGTPNP